MARTTKEEVRTVNPSLESMPDATLDAMISAANTMVNKLAESDCGSSLSDETLTQIETWLAAHYATVADPNAAGATEVKFEGSMKKYAIAQSSGEGILSTRYGQTADNLSCGCLVELQLRNTTVDRF